MTAWRDGLESRARPGLSRHRGGTAAAALSARLARPGSGPWFVGGAGAGEKKKAVNNADLGRVSRRGGPGPTTATGQRIPSRPIPARTRRVLALSDLYGMCWCALGFPVHDKLDITSFPVGKMRSLRTRYSLFTAVGALFVFWTVYPHHSLPHSITERIQDVVAQMPPAPAAEHTIVYKPRPTAKARPVVDNFPLAAAARSAADLPPIPSWNRPPAKHVPENTPLFIGFTRNWPLLQQVVVSYITAGWPPEDIYVVENTGVMDSNAQGRLSLQNPFFLNHTRLEILGVNILVTPTLFTFAQLQNFYLWHSVQSKWSHYFWSHMDVVALSFEDQYFAAHEESGLPILPPSDPKHDYSDYKSVYANCVETLRNVTIPMPLSGTPIKWALRFFSYDRLSLVNVAAFVDVGGWDTSIPFYMTDCDMHARLEMAEYSIEEVPAGMIFDVASSLDDLLVLYRKKNTPEASFVDPNAVEKELAAETEYNKTHVSRRAEGSDSSTEAWLEYAAGALHLPGSSKGKKFKWEEDEIHSPSLLKLIEVLDAMQRSKHESPRGRNTWQGRQTGGEGDPFYRDSVGFEQAIWLAVEHGKRVFREKWGHRDCDIVAMGLKQSDAWRVEHDWVT
ncbi:hypothetical protein B2J93_1109 [Marssonina coronariae]|uniref:Uncharacterized protein n=1 Tax=Diplocarpon coronariae TaxID=2795749 RepID=A0A218YRM6_9HELO|nr:hypothetical protein B2J93_1109 [Marssonina coronariae]